MNLFTVGINPITAALMRHEVAHECFDTPALAVSTRNNIASSTQGFAVNTSHTTASST